jgi:hypothetical protein
MLLVVEAFRFMHRSQRFGCLVYPLVLFVSLAAPRLLAQDSTSAPPPSQPQRQQQPENPQQEQVHLAQEAQSRIEARRREKVARAIQDTYSHKYELFGGGGYQRFHPGEHLQHINEYVWNAGFTAYEWPRLGLTGELRGNYGVAYTGQNIYGLFKPSISQYLVMAGPQYRIVRHEHIAVGAQLLAGAAKGIFNGNSAGFPGPLLGMWPNSTSVAFSAGVPIDFNLGPGLAVRLTLQDLVTNYGGSWQIKALGFTSGIVYRFGRR